MPFPRNPFENPYINAYKGYLAMANSGEEQPQSTHADRFDKTVGTVLPLQQRRSFLNAIGLFDWEDNPLKTLKKLSRLSIQTSNAK